MNLVWTPKSGNKGPVLLCSDAVAKLLIAKGSAIDLDCVEVIPTVIKSEVPKSNSQKPKKQTKK